MKVLKKISLVYVLQIFAVLLLFGYAGQAPANEPKGALPAKVLPLQVNKKPVVKPDGDSLLTLEITGLPTAFRGKSR
jgi:hypothetical protein